jgi:hypothetical protein
MKMYDEWSSTLLVYLSEPADVGFYYFRRPYHAYPAYDELQQARVCGYYRERMQLPTKRLVGPLFVALQAATA